MELREIKKKREIKRQVMHLIWSKYDLASQKRWNDSFKGRKRDFLNIYEYQSVNWNYKHLNWNLIWNYAKLSRNVK